MIQFLAMLPELLGAVGSAAGAAGTAQGAQGGGNLMNGILQAGGGLTGPDGLTRNMPGYGKNPDGTPSPPSEGSPYATGGDASGFANAGMQAPALDDPMSQLKMLMSMAPEQQPRIQQQQGNLMSYLQSLGV